MLCPRDSVRIDRAFITAAKNFGDPRRTSPVEKNRTTRSRNSFSPSNASLNFRLFIFFPLSILFSPFIYESDLFSRARSTKSGKLNLDNAKSRDTRAYVSSLIKIIVFLEREEIIFTTSYIPIIGTDLECTHSISIDEEEGSGEDWLDTQSKGMGKSYTRVYVIERGLAIYIAIGVVIIVNRAPVRGGRRRECKRAPAPAKDRVYTRPRTRSLVRVEQRLRGRRPEEEGTRRVPTDDLASLCISPRSLPSRFRSSFPRPTCFRLFSSRSFVIFHSILFLRTRLES